MAAKKIPLPPVDELAAMVRESTAIAVAGGLGCSPETVRRALKGAGYTGGGRSRNAAPVEQVRFYEQVEPDIRVVFPAWDPQPWADGAICGQTDPAVFFPAKGESVKAAKRLCAGCDVRDECLEYAIRNEMVFGIWGGMSLLERRAEAKKRRAEVAA